MSFHEEQQKKSPPSSKAMFGVKTLKIKESIASLSMYTPQGPWHRFDLSRDKVESRKSGNRPYEFQIQKVKLIFQRIFLRLHLILLFQN